MTRAFVLVLVPVLALTSFLGGCRAGQQAVPRTDGPVRLGSTSGTICLPVNAKGAYTMGFDLLRNSGKQTVTINGVRTVGGSGVTVAESYLLPVTKGDVNLVGVGPWPPKKPPSSWELKMPAVGPDRLSATDDSLTGWNLVLRLNATEPEAGYNHLALDYSLDGVAYEAANQIGLAIRKPC